MNFKKIFYYILIVIAVFFMGFGFLFLIASAGDPSRLNIAAVSGFIGASLIYFSLSAIRHIDYNSPSNLGPLIIKIAGKNNGYFSAREVMARLGITFASFDAAVKSMLSEGLAVEEMLAEGMVYKVVTAAAAAKRKCEFCGSEFNVRDTVTKCPGCGGNVTVIK